MSTAPRLFFDVSFVATSTANTGIHRVVRQLLREMIDDPEWKVTPFCASDSGARIVSRDEVNRNIFAPFGLLRPPELSEMAPLTSLAKLMHAATRIKANLLNLTLPRTRNFIANLSPAPAWQTLIIGARTQRGSLANLAFSLLAAVRSPATSPPSLRFCEVLTADDTILLIDATWHITRLGEMLEDIHCQGAQINTVVYDVIPIQFPDCVHPGLKLAFDRWFVEVARYSQRILCISEAESANVKHELLRLGFTVQASRVSHFALASMRSMSGDQKKSVSAKSRRQITQIESLPSPCFLMVGTVEPRKNHAIVLRAFSQFLQSGGTGSLLIIGASGWGTEATQVQLKARLTATNPILWLSNADDQVLEAAYSKSACVIQASICEGYGLPVAEAMLRCKPLICSELAVFREVAGAYPIAYVPVNNVSAMADALHLGASMRERAASLLDTADVDAIRDWTTVASEISIILATSSSDGHAPASAVR